MVERAVVLPAHGPPVKQTLVIGFCAPCLLSCWLAEATIGSSIILVLLWTERLSLSLVPAISRYETLLLARSITCSTFLIAFCPCFLAWSFILMTYSLPLIKLGEPASDPAYETDVIYSALETFLICWAIFSRSYFSCCAFFSSSRACAAIIFFFFWRSF